MALRNYLCCISRLPAEVALLECFLSVCSGLKMLPLSTGQSRCHLRRGFHDVVCMAVSRGFTRSADA